MRSLAICGVAVALGVVALPAQEAAARPRKPAKLVVVVLPFGEEDVLQKGVEKAIAKRRDAALARHRAAAAVEGALDDAGASAFEPAKLAAILGGHGVDVLVRLRATRDGIALTAYGKDGLPRVQEDLSVDADPQTIDAINSALDPALATWTKLKPLPMPPSGSSSSLSSSSSGRPRGLVVDGEGGDDDEGAAGDRASLLHAVAGDQAGDDAKPPKVKHHASIDDDDDGGEEHGGDDGGDHADDHASDAQHDGGAAHESIDDIEAAQKKADGLRHAVTFSGGLDLGTWHWSFDGGSDPRLATAQSVPVYPGASALFDVWPLSFAGIRFIGVDAEIAGALLPYTLVGTPVGPQEFTSPTVRAAAMLKLRYTFDGGVGVGVRAGYRTAIGGSAAQKTSIDGTVHDVTAIPAYRLRAFAAGVDLFVPLEVAGHPLEIEARLEGLPLSTYEEAPDNPGAVSLAYGGAGMIAARYIDVSGAFFEARVEGLGIYDSFTDDGTRKVIVDHALADTAGGTVLNLSATATLGAGFSF